ncbi:MAG: hypothetical protein HXS52_06170 [Theionarchaea archaeon]|nr:hypothetical protein [Theionarchaea archaeon]MBU7037497.1 hypothetical protein [Theionarchaea archaeon]
MFSQQRKYTYQRKVYLAWIGIVLCLLALSFMSFLEGWLIVSVGIFIVAVYWLAETFYGFRKSVLVTTDDEIIITRSLLFGSFRIPTKDIVKIALKKDSFWPRATIFFNLKDGVRNFPIMVRSLRKEDKAALFEYLENLQERAQ